MASFLNENLIEASELISGLKELNSFPSYIQFSKSGKLFFVASKESKPSAETIMDYEAFIGVSTSKYKALSKSLTEYIERKVCRNNSLLPRANEGVAGMSYSSLRKPELTEKLAKENSENEALERYAWATWWDNQDITHELLNFDFKKFKHNPVFSIFLYIESIFPNGNFKIIIPSIDNIDKELVIILFFLENDKGVVSGGACGKKINRYNNIERAASELVRHCKALSRFKINNLAPKHFYDERLVFFGTKEGADIAHKRIHLTGNSMIKLPNFEFSKPINHPFEEVVYLYQSLFFNQPVFIGGDLKRLCI